MIVANDATVKGGTYYPITVKKHLRAQEIAEQNNLPCIYMGTPFSSSSSHPSRFGRRQSPHPSGRVPRSRPFRPHFLQPSHHVRQENPPDLHRTPFSPLPLSQVFGSCTAGGAYVPCMSDQTIMVRGNGTIFLGGPPLVKAATGEEISAQDLGGADVHSRLSGVTDYVADSEREACDICREIIQHCNLKPSVAFSEQPIDEPLFDCAEIAGIIPKDTKKSFDVRELIARIVDGSRFLEFKKEYGPTMVTGFASLYNMPLGIVANNGILFSESTLKAVHFIELCSQRKIPLLFLQNITGFMIGSEYERQGIAKHGRCLPGVRSRREARQRGLHHAVSEDYAHRRRQLWRWELRNGRPRLLAAFSVHVSE